MSDTPKTDAIRRVAGMMKSITVEQIKELERENAALRKALEFAVAAYKEEDWPYVMADNFYAVSCVARIALNGKEAQP